MWVVGSVWGASKLQLAQPYEFGGSQWGTWSGGDSQLFEPPFPSSSTTSLLRSLEPEPHHRKPITGGQNACASIYSSLPPLLHSSSAVFFFLFFLFFFSCCSWGGEDHQRWPQERLDQARDQVHLRFPSSRSPLPWGLLAFSLSLSLFLPLFLMDLILIFCFLLGWRENEKMGQRVWCFLAFFFRWKRLLTNWT